MFGDGAEVVHDSGAIVTPNKRKRMITGRSDDLGPFRINIHIDTYEPSQGKATLELWTGLGWVDACFRFGGELLDKQFTQGVTHHEARDTGLVALDLYDELTKLFSHDEED